MQKEECVGCKTHFEQGCKLPLEGLCIELKNYPIPIKDYKHKWILLKTICSFLNSKGGTIFIGADDSTGEVKGVSIQRKERDDFKIFIQQLSERIQPKVDLSDREDIVVQFAPVLAKGKFLGKYLIKIIVKQGEPTQLYCFNQKLQLMSTGDKKNQQYEIVYSYKRLNMGNIKQLKGYELVLQAKNKAAKPLKIIECFHQGCNPQPLNLQVQILKLGFSKIPSEQMRAILEQWFQSFLQQLNIEDFSVLYDPQNDMIIVELPTKNQFLKVEGFVSKNIQQLNSNLSGYCNFVKKQTYLGCYLYENKIKNVSYNQNQNNHNKESQKYKKYVKKQKKMMSQQSSTQQLPKKYIKQQRQNYSQKQAKENAKKQMRQVQNKIQKKQQKSLKNSREAKKQQHDQMYQKNSPKKMSKRFSLTFTHINPKARQNLVQFLQAILQSYKSFETYENTVQMFLPNQENFEDALEIIIYYKNDLTRFGFKGEIRFGINSGQITIINFDRTKQRKFQDYLKKLIGKQIRKIEAIIKGNRCAMEIHMVSKQAACQWLDKLLIDKPLKDFKIPGSQNNKFPKMKVFLDCIPLTELFEIQFMN